MFNSRTSFIQMLVIMNNRLRHVGSGSPAEYKIPNIEFAELNIRALGVALCLLCGALLFVPASFAQEPTLKDMLEDSAAQEEGKKAEVIAKPPAPLGPEDEFGRGVPRSTALGYLNATKERDFERAAEYLDLRNLPRGMSAEQGLELADQLKVVLDRALWIDINALSDDPMGHSDDNLPSYRDWVGKIDLPDGSVDVLLQRVPRGDGVFIWKFSNATVANIPQLYDVHGYGPFGEVLVEWLPAYSFLGFELWQWVGAIILLIVGYLIAMVPTAIVAWLVKRRNKPMSGPIAAFIRFPVRILVALIIARQFIDLLSPTVEARAILQGQTFLLLVWAWVFLRLINIMRDHLIEVRSSRGATAGPVLLRPAANALKGLVVIIFALLWLENLGFNATTILAGLGVGGIALALAAQKSIENMIGAVMLYSSQPVRIGDFCRFGDKMGVVEEIGLRATSIRTLDRTVIHVPNAAFADMHIENFAEREKIRFCPKISLRLDTTPDQIRSIIAEIKKMLLEHVDVDDDPARVRFSGFGGYSLDLDIFAYVPTTDVNHYLEVVEDLHLRIMDIISAAGTALAAPTRTVWNEDKAPPDRDAVARTEAEV